MRNRPFLLIVVCLLCSLITYANTGGRDRKEDPDLMGVILHAENGKPIKDVYVTAYNSTKKEKIAMSDANGNFNLVDLKPGVYKFVFQKDGFKKVVRDKIVLKTNEDFQLNIEMAQEENLYDLMPFPLRFVGV